MKTHPKDQSLMTDGHESSNPVDALGWTLARGQVRRLRIGPGSRCLRVEAGQVWLTETSARLQPLAMASDCWLRAGEQHCLASGAEVLVEARVEARFVLLVPPQAGVGGGGLPTLASAWLGALRRWWQPSGARAGRRGGSTVLHNRAAAHHPGQPEIACCPSIALPCARN